MCFGRRAFIRNSPIIIILRFGYYRPSAEFSENLLICMVDFNRRATKSRPTPRSFFSSRVHVRVVVDKYLNLLIRLTSSIGVRG